jgi:small subunit ribosomal protein S7e
LRRTRPTLTSSPLSFLPQTFCPPRSLSPRAQFIVKKGAAPSALELAVAKDFASIAAGTSNIKNDVANLKFAAAKEVDLEGGKKALLIFVPVPLLAAFRKVQKHLVEELEKKRSGQHVLVVANRTMVSSKTWTRSAKYSGVRPRSRSLKAVQEAILDDLVFPSEIVGKRTRVRVDGSRLLKVSLSPKEQAAVEAKLDSFRSVYKAITSKDVAFEFS